MFVCVCARDGLGVQVVLIYRHIYSLISLQQPWWPPDHNPTDDDGTDIDADAKANAFTYYIAHRLPQLETLDGKELTRSLRRRAARAFPALEVRLGSIECPHVYVRRCVCETWFDYVNKHRRAFVSWRPRRSRRPPPSSKSRWASRRVGRPAGMGQGKTRRRRS